MTFNSKKLSLYFIFHIIAIEASEKNRLISMIYRPLTILSAA